MSMLEQLPEDLRRYRNLKDSILKLEKELEPLRDQIITEMKVMGAVSKEQAYRVPGVRVQCLTCHAIDPTFNHTDKAGEWQACDACEGKGEVKHTPLKAYISPTKRESISVREARFLLDTPTQIKLIKSSESLVLRVEEDKE